MIYRKKRLDLEVKNTPYADLEPIPVVEENEPTQDMEETETKGQIIIDSDLSIIPVNEVKPVKNIKPSLEKSKGSVFIEEVTGDAVVVNTFENMPKQEFLNLYKQNQMKLTILEQRFVENYCDLLNGTESAILAGYSQNRASASVQASRLLKKDYIQTAISMRPLYLSYVQNIPTKEGIRQRLTKIIDDESNTPIEVMRALDMLAKLDFHYVKEQVKEDNSFEIVITTTEEVARLQEAEEHKLLDVTEEEEKSS